MKALDITQTLSHLDESVTTPAPGSQGRRGWQDLTICHLSPEGGRLDPRAYTRQALPAAALGLRAMVASPHDANGLVGKVHCVSLPKSRNRFMSLLLAAEAAFPLQRLAADLYHVHNPVMLPAGFILKFLFGKKVIYDTREDYPAMMLNKAYLPRPVRRLVGAVVRDAERLGARCLDGIITADSGTMRPLARAGRSKKLVFYNLPNLRFFPEPKPVPKRYDIVYRGGLSERTGTFVLLEALRRLADQGRSASLLMFGYVDNEAVLRQIRERIRTFGLESQVELKGFIKFEEMGATLSEARISVSPLLAIAKFLNNIPVKVFESWACGLPVISSDLPPIRPFFNGERYGLLVKPGDAGELARALERLLDNPGEAEQMGQRGRKAVLQRYHNEGEVRKLLAFYQRVLEH